MLACFTEIKHFMQWINPFSRQMNLIHYHPHTSPSHALNSVGDNFVNKQTNPTQTHTKKKKTNKREKQQLIAVMLHDHAHMPWINLSKSQFSLNLTLNQRRWLLLCRISIKFSFETGRLGSEKNVVLVVVVFRIDIVWDLCCDFVLLKFKPHFGSQFVVIGIIQCNPSKDYLSFMAFSVRSLI